MSDIIDRFLNIACCHEHRPAVIKDGKSTTYGELAAKARRYAAVFSTATAPCVMITLPPGADAYAAMLGALLGGGYYAPINVHAPLGKLQDIARRLAPNFLIAEADFARTIMSSTHNRMPILLDPSVLPLAEERAESRHELAYVTFTSGSTGKPKGVVVPRSALSHYVDWISDELKINPDDRMSQQANLGFDLSVLEIYGALCSGATLYPAENAYDRLRPARMIKRHELTVWISVASSLGLMSAAKEVRGDLLGTVRLFLQCGEPLLPQHLRTIFKACPNAVFYNMYGPTEATVSVTDNRMTRDTYEAECDGAAVAIGDAIPGVDLDLLGDTADHGEIVIRGPQVALGYLGDQALTEQAFSLGVPRSYRTGDWARRRGNKLFFEQRIDHQVKIRGLRIELGEIESALADIGWPISCAFKWNDVLAVVIQASHADTTDIRARLLSFLEDYKIPSYIDATSSMPINENGKLDRPTIIAWFEQKQHMQHRVPVQEE
jgi:D-alanine--poly(phosphoribitol) ligase subunit 1